MVTRASRLCRLLSYHIAVFIYRLPQETFAGVGEEYNFSGLTGSTMNSHRLTYWAGIKGWLQGGSAAAILGASAGILTQLGCRGLGGPEAQDRLMMQLFKAYFTQVVRCTSCLVGSLQWQHSTPCDCMVWVDRRQSTSTTLMFLSKRQPQRALMQMRLALSWQTRQHIVTRYGTRWRETLLRVTRLQARTHV